ncbi:MAG TPA: hypothetical protein VGI87_02735 [Solirubrobacteraceae bacterium]
MPLRGAWTGNRGILHEGQEIVRFHAHEHWLTCALRFKDRWHEQWQPRHFTWLYFHDEAVSFAAGHRPCAECRRASYNAFRAAWADGLGVDVPAAKELDHQLHGERIVRGTHRRRLHPMPWSALPDGAFVQRRSGPALVLGSSLVTWGPHGYGTAAARPPRGHATVITPPALVAVLAAGYPVQIDDGAREARHAIIAHPRDPVIARVPS